jgi:glutamate dehydrogenase (NAD(P)+)
VRFGRINKRWDERGRTSMLQVLEEQVGRQLSDKERKYITQGAEEHDLVYSGLEDTMIQACQETRATALEQKVDHRTAAFLNSLNKIASAYLGSGIMFMK